MEEEFTYAEVLEAYLECRKEKRNTRSALEFEFQMESNLFSLLEDLNSGDYSPRPSECFVVLEPKPREVFAADFRDRIVHHLLVGELEEIYEKKFIHDSGACRKGKGTHFCVDRLEKFLRQVTENRTEKAYYIQLDISGFFMNIDREILYRLIQEQVREVPKPEGWKEKVLWLSRKIIFNDPTEGCIYKGKRELRERVPDRKSLFEAEDGKGLPIGNYSSQFFANVYLNELDQFVKRGLKCEHYLRYVDDFVLLSKDKEELKKWRDRIIQFLGENLELELNRSKDRLQSVDKGIDFLGYFVKPDHRLVRNRVLRNLKEKLESLKSSLPKKSPSEDFLRKVVSTVNSYYGHFKHADSYRLRKHLWEEHFGPLKEYLVPADEEFSHVRIKPEVKEKFSRS